MIVGTLTALLAIYFGLVCIVYVSQRSLMYSPGTTVSGPEVHNLPGMKNLEVTTADGLIIVYGKSKTWLYDLIISSPANFKVP